MLMRRPYRGYWSNWREMDRMRREMNRLLSQGSWAGAPSFPAMNVWINEDGAIVTAELPGVDTEQLDITVTGDTLTISGERQRKELEEGETYHRRERGTGRFSRTFQLPFEVESQHVSASYKSGILHIELPRSEADKPKKISIQPG